MAIYATIPSFKVPYKLKSKFTEVIKEIRRIKNVEIRNLK